MRNAKDDFTYFRDVLNRLNQMHEAQEADPVKNSTMTETIMLAAVGIARLVGQLALAAHSE